MAYFWDFFTGNVGTQRTCHRGPMIDVETQMSTPFSVMSDYEVLRTRLLENIVDTPLVAVSTRECVLRVLNSDLGPILVRLYSQKKDLQTYVCEKRHATEIDEDIAVYPISYAEGARGFLQYRVPQQSIDLLLSALESHSPFLRVASRCAVVLIAAYIVSKLASIRVVTCERTEGDE